MSTRHEITAIIYDKRGRVLSIGKNSYIKTHTIQARHAFAVGLPDKKFLHAEIDAIIKCKSIDKAHKIFISRSIKTGYGLAKPCPVCERAIKMTGIKVIEHT
jgi:deoxycytidylate deaminase